MTEQIISNDTVVIERTFDAPVDIVWQMWTKAEHFSNWFGPKGFTIPVAEMDARVGGKRLICMVSPDGNMKMWFTGEYTEVVPNERLVYTDSFADENGNVVAQPNGSMSVPSTVTVVFEDLGGRTKMLMTHAGLPTEQQQKGSLQGAIAGWGQSFNKMADYIKQTA